MSDGGVMVDRKPAYEMIDVPSTPGTSGGPSVCHESAYEEIGSSSGGSSGQAAVASGEVVYVDSSTLPMSSDPVANVPVQITDIYSTPSKLGKSDGGSWPESGMVVYDSTAGDTDEDDSSGVADGLYSGVKKSPSTYHPDRPQLPTKRSSASSLPERRGSRSLPPSLPAKEGSEYPGRGVAEVAAAAAGDDRGAGSKPGPKAGSRAGGDVATKPSGYVNNVVDVTQSIFIEDWLKSSAKREDALDALEKANLGPGSYCLRLSGDTTKTLTCVTDKGKVGHYRFIEEHGTFGVPDVPELVGETEPTIRAWLERFSREDARPLIATVLKCCVPCPRHLIGGN